ncbi:MAG: peptide chain release factor N(5)-glutamine methyltransferase [Lachnobacterium sp.]|nr:peptide chain release factor N(5)-glutamine methyltransferase [Lachnobacterium sp.]MDD6633698.1 peptide chain release factor N(5)-glutamine methyltransferase [Lachnobacterium sp.]MDY2911416.1 peptide chain release factor N(5)-glutamine methyltransferase [Agathobacter sp.]
MTYKETIDFGIRILELAGIEEAENDAWLLLSKECKMNRTAYYMHMKDEILPEQLNEYKGLIKKRAERVPLQYITGEQEFMGLTFHVNSNVLIPRQDTETLVEEAIKLVEPGMSILDMCTGSGCIIISILKKCSGIQGTGSDISKQALNVAKKNAKLNNVAVDFERSDMFENISDKYDMIVSNPPYIRSDVVPTLMPEVCEFEPLDALDGHEDGLYFYRKIIKECKSFLKEDGKILFEIGNDQGQAVSDMLTYAGFRNVGVIKDLAHNDRVVVGML